MKTNTLITLTILSLVLFYSCKTEHVYIEFSEDELLWTPYESGEKIIFSSNQKTDTFYVQKNISNEQISGTMFSVGNIYHPIQCYLNLYSDSSVINFRLIIEKGKELNSFTGSFNINSTSKHLSMKLNDYSFIDTVSVNSVLYDSVFVYNADSIHGLKKFYYKKGIGLLKYIDSNDKIWYFKE